MPRMSIFFRLSMHCSQFSFVYLCLTGRCFWSLLSSIHFCFGSVDAFCRLIVAYPCFAVSFWDSLCLTGQLFLVHLRQTCKNVLSVSIPYRSILFIPVCLTGHFSSVSLCLRGHLVGVHLPDRSIVLVTLCLCKSFFGGAHSCLAVNVLVFVCLTYQFLGMHLPDRSMFLVSPCLCISF